MWQWMQLKRTRYDKPAPPLPWDVEEMGSEGCRIYSVPLRARSWDVSTVLYPVPKLTAMLIVQGVNRLLESKEVPHEQD